MLVRLCFHVVFISFVIVLFSASCYNCNKTGHFARDCPDSTKTCYVCGKSGHISRDCERDDRKVKAKNVSSTTLTRICCFVSYHLTSIGVGFLLQMLSIFFSAMDAEKLATFLVIVLKAIEMIVVATSVVAVVIYLATVLKLVALTVEMIQCVTGKRSHTHRRERERDIDTPPYPFLPRTPS